MKTNNKGFTLVELLVVIGVGAAISAGIASIIFTSLKLYDKESTNVSAQYEIQTTLNMVEDSIMASQGLVVKNSPANIKVDDDNDGVKEKDETITKTDYALLGVFEETGTGTTKTVKFSGTVYVTGAIDPSSYCFDVYMMKVNGLTVTGSDTEPFPALKIAQNAVKTITDATDKREYVLGKDATHFSIVPETSSYSSDAHSVVKGTNKGLSYEGYFNDHITMNVDMQFEKDIRGRSALTKHVKDQAVMRNRIDVDVFIDDKAYEYIKNKKYNES